MDAQAQVPAAQRSIGKNWMLTANNMDVETFRAILERNKDDVQVCHWQLERGT